MKDLYRFHDPEEYSCIKKRLFSFSVVADAINIVHAAIEEEIAGYLTKTYNGEYKNTSFQDTDEAIVVSLYTRAKSALLNRKVVKRKSIRAKVNSVSDDAVKEFEDGLYSPPESEQMRYPDS